MPSIALPVSLRGQLLYSAAFDPSRLAVDSTAFLWLDPSDLSTMFQDTAGTTPVTAPAQTIGLVLDKSQGLVLGPELFANQPSVLDNSGGGATVTHTPQTRTVQVTSAGTNTSYPRLQIGIGATTGRRYVVSGRIDGDRGLVNLVRLALAGAANNLAYNPSTGVFNGIQEAGASPSLEVHVNGTQLGTVTVATFSVRELPGFHATQPTAANRPTYGVVPSRGRVNILNATATLATQTRPVTAAQHTLSFRGTGTVTLSGASTAGPLVGTGANDIISLTFTPTAGNLTLTVSGTVNDAQLELGAARGTYQLVADGAGFNISDPAGFPSYPLHYLYFGGDLDPRWLQTATITPNADKVQVFAGVRALSFAAENAIVEFGAAATSGEFRLVTLPPSSYRFSSRGTVFVGASGAGYTAPTQNILSGLGDISGDTVTMRINATQTAQNTADQGTGNYLAYPLFIGRRGGTSAAFNGNLYGLIVRFSTTNLDASVISQTERWMAQKTGVTL